LNLEQLEERITPSTFTVTDLTDNAADTGSIRYALNQVNADTSSAADTIDLTGVSGTITLSNGVLALARTTGPVTITGPGASALTISGNTATQVFDVAANATVSISGLTIANGETSGAGGGISSFGTLSIANSAFTGDTSTVSNGGGIWNGGTLSIVNSAFTGDTSTLYSGGAIYNNSTLLISSCSFTSDTAGGGGGAIYNNSALTVAGCTFTTNSAIKSDGGAIWQDGTLSLSGSMFNGNTAGSEGGAIYSSSGTMSINGCTFNSNSAPSGGAIFAFNNNSTGSLTIGDTTFSGNAATNGSGGGILNGYDGVLNINSSTFSGNSATVDGGGASFGGNHTALSNSTFTGNTAANGDGGGFYIASGAAVSMLSSIVVGNTTTNLGTPNDVSVGAGSLNALESAYNLIGTGGAGGLVQGSNNNQVGVSVASADLGALAFNGGPTQTNPLLNGSAALQAGSAVLAFCVAPVLPISANNTILITDATFLAVGAVIEIDSEQMQITAISGKTLTVIRGYDGTTVAAHSFGATVLQPTDQRGVARTVGGFTDIGAVEQNLPGSAPVAPPTFTYTTFKVTDLTDNLHIHDLQGDRPHRQCQRPRQHSLRSCRGRC
jgi:predicted outer membrane repeat protein